MTSLFQSLALAGALGAATLGACTSSRNIQEEPRKQELSFEIPKQNMCEAYPERNGEYVKTNTICRIPDTEYAIHLVTIGRVFDYPNGITEFHARKMGRDVQMLGLHNNNFKAIDNGDHLINRDELMLAIQHRYGKEFIGYENRNGNIRLLSK